MSRYNSVKGKRNNTPIGIGLKECFFSPKHSMVKRKKSSDTKQKMRRACISVARRLADILIDIGYLVTEPFETHYHHHWGMEGWPEEIPAYRLRQEVKRMRDRGWIREAEKNGKKFLKLTEKGRLEMLYRRLKATCAMPKNTWDRKWRLIMFDIPEQGRRERDAIRDVLKSTGFYQMQKSVYIYPHDIPTDAITYLKDSGLWAYIRFARVERMENDNDAKKYFNLK